LTKNKVVNYKIDDEFSVFEARAIVSKIAGIIGFNKSDQIKITIAVSEIAWNTIMHADGGKMSIQALENREGIEITITDEGMGILDIDQAMKDGNSSNNTSLGCGLGGAKRLMDEFILESRPGEGTQVTMRKYLNPD